MLLLSARVQWGKGVEWFTMRTDGKEVFKEVGDTKQGRGIEGSPPEKSG